MWLFVIIFFIRYNRVDCYIDSDSVLVYETVKAYHKLLSFIEEYLNKMNMDGLFAMSIAQANLDGILRLSIPPKIVKAIKLLSIRTNKAVDDRLEQIQRTETFGESFTANMFFNALKIISANFWSNNQTFYRNGLLNRLNAEWLEDYSFSGSPNEIESEFCLAEIYQLEVHIKKECALGTMCKNIFTDLNTSHGYALIHKVLFWQIFKRAKCIDHYNVKNNLRTLCSRVLSETKGIMMTITGNRILSDLFLEQVLLCGIEGYEEFLERREWLQTILKWQNSHGCYETESKRRRRRKRDINVMAFGCENHHNGLALAYLSLNLNYLLTTNKNIYNNYL